MKNNTCPTCRRRPSERHHRPDMRPPSPSCPDPIHDLADAAPEMRDALKWVLNHPSLLGAPGMAQARAVLALTETT